LRWTRLGFQTVQETSGTLPFQEHLLEHRHHWMIGASAANDFDCCPVDEVDCCGSGLFHNE
jgi:hypothetical protein